MSSTAYWYYFDLLFVFLISQRPRVEATRFAIKNGSAYIWSNKTIEWTYKYFIFAVDGGTPKRGDRIPLTITFNATCQETGGIFVNATSGQVFFRAPGMTGSEYRELQYHNSIFDCYLETCSTPPPSKLRAFQWPLVFNLVEVRYACPVWFFVDTLWFFYFFLIGCLLWLS